MSGLDCDSNQNQDDFYGDQDVSVEAEVARRSREVEALRQRHFKVGLREGASDARDSTLQGGFDRGFAEGAKATAEPGFIFGVCSVLDLFYPKIESAKKNESIHDANLSVDENNREALQQDLQDVRDSKKRLSVWLRDAPVQSEMDANDIREVCERVVPFAAPKNDDDVGGNSNSSERNAGNSLQVPDAETQLFATK